MCHDQLHYIFAFLQYLREELTNIAAIRADNAYSKKQRQ